MSTSKKQKHPPILQASLDKMISDWKTEYTNIAIDLCCRLQYIDGGLFRYYAKKRGLENPTTHNQWVAMVRVLQKLGYIAKTDLSIKSRSPYNHMNAAPVWESRLFTGTREDWDVHKYDSYVSLYVGPLRRRKKYES